MASILLVGLLAIFLGQFCPISAQFKCPDDAEKHEDSNDSTCRGYIECADDGWQTRKCAVGFVFYQGMQCCVPSDSYNCREPKFNCPSEHGNFPDPKNCTRYFYCYKHLALHRTCRGEKGFSAAMRICHEDYANCTNEEELEAEPQVSPVGSRIGNNNPSPLCPSPESRISANINGTCNYYFQCTQGKATLQQCQEINGIKFNFYPGLNECVPPDQYDCHAPQFFCQFPNTDYPDPDDCHRYFRCRGAGRGILALHLTCPEGMDFNPHPMVSRCVLSNPYLCRSNVGRRNRWA